MEPQRSGDLEVWRSYRSGGEIWSSGGCVGLEPWSSRGRAGMEVWMVWRSCRYGSAEMWSSGRRVACSISLSTLVLSVCESCLPVSLAFARGLVVVIVALHCLTDLIHGSSLVRIVLNGVHNLDHDFAVGLPVALPVGGEKVGTTGEVVAIFMHTWPVLLLVAAGTGAIIRRLVVS
jgi:hypothetical protein